MGAHRFGDEAGEMTKDEVGGVLRAVAWRDTASDRADGRTLPRVADVAEALRMDPAEVEALLREVRATAQEAVSVARPRESAFAVAGWVVAALALGWVALEASAPRLSPPSPVAPSRVPVAPKPSFEPLFTPPVSAITVVPTAFLPPPGFRVGVVANGASLELAGRSDVRANVGGDARRKVADAIAWMAERAAAVGESRMFGPGHRLPFGETSRTIKVWVEGNGTNVGFELSNEGRAGRLGISEIKSRRRWIDAALEGLFYSEKRLVGPVSGSDDFVFSPAGFEVSFSGRRRSGSRSGTATVAPLDRAAAEDGLYRSMRSMMDHDLVPRPGRWRQDAERERALRTPDASHFTIETLSGKLEFDVPTKASTPAATQDALLRRKAWEAVAEYARAGKG